MESTRPSAEGTGRSCACGQGAPMRDVEATQLEYQVLVLGAREIYSVLIASTELRRSSPSSRRCASESSSGGSLRAHRAPQGPGSRPHRQSIGDSAEVVTILLAYSWSPFNEACGLGAELWFEVATRRASAGE